MRFQSFYQSAMAPFQGSYFQVQSPVVDFCFLFTGSSSKVCSFHLDMWYSQLEGAVTTSQANNFGTDCTIGLRQTYENDYIPASELYSARAAAPIGVSRLAPHHRLTSRSKQNTLLPGATPRFFKPSCISDTARVDATPCGKWLAITAVKSQTERHLFVRLWCHYVDRVKNREKAV
jgi:hypothetical protein